MSGALSALIEFWVRILFSLFAYAVLLRFFLQWVKADFYNPICQLLCRVTSPLLKPLRKIIPGLGGMDFAAVVLAYLTWLVQSIILMLLQGQGVSPALFIVALIQLILGALSLYTWLIIFRVIASWLNPNNYNPAIVVLFQLTEPVLTKIRQRLPTNQSGLDFAPMIAILILFSLQILVKGFFF